MGASLVLWLLCVHVVAAAKDCAHRHGGAFVMLQIGSGPTAQQSSQWLEDDAFIDMAIRRARRHLRGAGAMAAIPVFNRVLNGTDCDENFSWHVDPKDVTWTEVATEVCDATPGYIEKNAKDWMSSPGRWCPWTTFVLSVEDRRSLTTQFFGKPWVHRVKGG